MGSKTVEQCRNPDMRCIINGLGVVNEVSVVLSRSTLSSSERGRERERPRRSGSVAQRDTALGRNKQEINIYRD